MRLRFTFNADRLVPIAAAAVLGSVLGFAYGNAFDRAIDLEKWQTLISSAIAIAIGVLAWTGTRGTQRLNILTREEDRLERQLPGLMQASSLLSFWNKAHGISSKRNTYSFVYPGLVAALGATDHDDLKAKIEGRIDLLDKRDFPSVKVAAQDYAYYARVVHQSYNALDADQIAAALDGVLDGTDEASRLYLRNLESLQAQNKLLVSMAAGFDRRIATTRKRLPALRTEIERFFDIA